MSRRYENKGRDLIPIETVQGNVYVGDARSRKRSDREMVWLKAFEKEVEGRLATSLHHHILINLSKESQPDQVHRLWDMEVKSGQITETIPPETEILTVFDRPEIAGKLLILGKPGSGKTTTLLELARALVRKAIDDPSEPMPFLLNLSSWKDPKQSIKDWAIAELTTRGIGSKLGKKWIEDQKLLPLFDGLDEVRSDLQPACVSAINQFLSSEEQPRSIIVCSRHEEYELYAEKLNLNGAIYLQELSDVQIQAYLQQVDRPSLWQDLSKDQELLALIRQPLLLSITLIAYQENLANQWQALQTTEERIQFLLNVYVQRMQSRDVPSRIYAGKKEPTPAQIQQWLSFLAKQLRKEATTEFMVEKIQPSWLSNRRQKWFYGVFASLLYGLALSIGFGLIWSLYFSFIVGVIAVFIDRVNTPIKTINHLKWSWKAFRAGLLPNLKLSLITGIILGLLTFFLVFPDLQIELKVIFGFLVGLFFGAVMGLLSTLFYGLAGSNEIETRLIPNQGIWQTLRNALLVGLSATGLVFLLCFVALVSIGFPRNFDLNISTFSASWGALVQDSMRFDLVGWLSLFLGLGVGILSALVVGGKSCIQHFSLRLVLFLSDRIPWNYARFLNYATDRMFLQRIGGRYRFIHKLLQDYFAQIDE